VRVIERPTVQEWEDVVSRSSYSTFFHTPTWAQIVVGAYPEFRIATKGFILDDGVVAIVPLVATTERNRYFRWCESMFPGGYGGAVAQRVLTPREVCLVYERLPDSRTAYLHVMGNPFSGQELPTSYSRSDQYTHLLNLGDGFEAAFKSFSAKHRYHTRKALQAGLTVDLADTEDEYWVYYHEVYADTLRRWGDATLIRFPYSLFEQIYQHRTEKARLWLARMNGRIVAGSLMFYHQGIAHSWHGAMLQSASRSYPAILLTTEIMRDACARGDRWYDLGPSGGLKGVEEFKERFGAERALFQSFTWQENSLYRAYHNLLRVGNSREGGSSVEAYAPGDRSSIRQAGADTSPSMP
jgi:CelD/BcsL family acetyltransferase involved in cellulose biosynthesis